MLFYSIASEFVTLTVTYLTLPYRFLWFSEKCLHPTVKVCDFKQKNGARLSIWRGLIFLAAFSAIPRPDLVSGRLGWAQNADIFWESLWLFKFCRNSFFFKLINRFNIVDIINTLINPRMKKKIASVVDKTLFCYN